MAPQRPELAPGQGVRARRTILKAADVQGGCFEVDLVPTQDFAWYTGRLAIGVFDDDTPRGPLEILEIRGQPYSG